LRIFIVEDNPLHAAKLEDLVEKLGHTICGIAESYKEALPKIVAIKPDLLFLDIQLDGDETGIHLAEKINENLNIPFVFLSSLTESDTLKLASKAIPEAYLIKPAKEDSLRAVLTLVEAKISQTKSEQKVLLNKNEKEVLFVKVGNYFKKIKTSEIIYINYTKDKFSQLHTTNGKNYPIKLGLTEVEQLLPLGFIRIHKSSIINKNYIEAIKSNFSELSLTGNIGLSVGRTYRKALEDLF
jgi:DNA-binding LytR/AlgR family response regulator